MGTIGFWGVVLAAVLFVVGNAAVVFLVVRLPAGYFANRRTIAPQARQRSPLDWTILLGKNLIGGGLVLIGAVLIFPGVPGPGLLLILVGVMLLDFPGKRRLEGKLVRRPSVRRSVDWLRRRFGKPPLLLDDELG